MSSKSYFLCILIGFAALHLNAQTEVSGSLRDSTGAAIGNVTITYRTPGQTNVLGFAKSENNGTFQFIVREVDLDSIQLDFRHLSYRSKQVTIPNKSTHHTFVLQKGDNLLEAVSIGNPPIYSQNDTLNYRVDAFRTADDRIIADIIRKLPGIEIQDGQILYQGRPIQRYMVNNLDLMGGRYGIINNNLPADAVRNVQIIENDQPIRILDSLVFTDRASLNLEIKKYSTTGTGKLGGGGGGGPALWDMGITPITLTKNFQALTSIQTNNVGHDAAKEVRSFYSGNILDSRSPFSQDPSSFFTIKNLIAPPLQEKKWRKNQVFLGSINTLQKLKNGLELRSNLAYHRDLLIREGHLVTQYLDQEHSFVTTEQIDNRYGLQAMDVGLNLEKNIANLFFKNNLSFRGKWDRDRGNLLFNSQDPISQHRKYQGFALSNGFTGMRFIGKQLVYFNSSLDWQQSPQQLQIAPGQLEDILNIGMPYDQLEQRVDYNAFSFINSAYFIRRSGAWRIRPMLGLHYLRNHIQSELQIKSLEEEIQLGEEYRNDIQHSWIKAATGATLGFESGPWVADLGIPYTLHIIGDEIRNAFNPSLRILYRHSQQHDFTFNAASGPSFDGMERNYGGYILQSYRSLQRFQNQVLSSYSNTLRMGYQFKNELQGTFANLSYAFNQHHREYTLGTQLDELGRTTIEILDHPNEQQSHLIRGGVSQFVNQIKTILKLNLSTGISQQDFILNNRSGLRNALHFGGDLEIINNLSSILWGNYRLEHTHIHSRMATGYTNRILTTNHFLDLNFLLYSKHTIGIQQAIHNYRIQDQTSSYFLDLTYRYSINKWKMDLEMVAINLLDNHRYIQEIATDYQVIQSFYELRPRQFVLAVKFQF